MDIEDIRKIQKEKYEKHLYFEKLKTKYNQLLEFDTIKRSADRITRYIKYKSKFSSLLKPVNITNDERKFICGLHIKRFIINKDLYIYNLKEIGPFCIKNLQKTIKDKYGLNRKMYTDTIRNWNKVNLDTKEGWQFMKILGRIT